MDVPTAGQSLVPFGVVPPPAPLPDLGALDLFCSVVELGSLSRAAQAHGVTQPSASSRIRALERRLGVRLLNRSATGSAPTADGRLVAEWATAVLSASASLQAGVDALQAHRGGRLRVVASFTVAEFLLPGWLATIAGKGAEVELGVMNSARVLEAVRAEQADIGFVESPGDTKGLRTTVVALDELCAVVAPAHPWARRRRPVDAATLAATSLVLRERGSGTRDSLEAALAASGHVGVAGPLELGSTTAVKTAVIGGAGPAVLSRVAVDAELASGRLVAVAVSDLDLSRRLRAVWKRTPEGPAAALLATARRSLAANSHRSVL